MKNTEWQLELVKDIEKIERRLEKANFVKGKPSLSVDEELLGFVTYGWITHTTVYSLGEESVTICNHERSIYGHPIYAYDRGDVVITRVGDETYRKILLDLP